MNSVPGIAVLFGTAIALSSNSPSAQSPDFPNRPIRFIVPYPPGGGATATFAALINNELKKYRTLLQSAGISQAAPQ